MNEEQARKMAERLIEQSVIAEPGVEMFIILHTGEEGLTPPPVEAATESGWSDEGHGSGHAFGPFVTEDEATEWERLMDQIDACGCRKALIKMVVPRILGIIGPAGVPVDSSIVQRAKDLRN